MREDRTNPSLGLKNSHLSNFHVAEVDGRT